MASVMVTPRRCHRMIHRSRLKSGSAPERTRPSANAFREFCRVARALSRGAAFERSPRRKPRGGREMEQATGGATELRVAFAPPGLDLLACPWTQGWRPGHYPHLFMLGRGFALLRTSRSIAASRAISFASQACHHACAPKSLPAALSLRSHCGWSIHSWAFQTSSPI